MKTTFLGKCTFGASVLLLPVLASCTPQAPANPAPPSTNASATAQSQTALPAEAAPAEMAAGAPDPIPPAPPPAPPAIDPGPAAPDTTATASVLPPYIFPTSPLAQVVRLSQAGVDDSIILTFVRNSSGTFNLDSDKIIYLRDIGLPSDVINAMMQRDQQLQQQIAAANPPPAPETDTNPPPEPPPPPTEPPPPPTTEVTTTYFYDTLAPYGSWVYVNGYGQCWRPTVCVYNPGWRPYCDHGRWIYTDCGWYWYSDYTWGWAPFHYGRWFQHPHWGWCWTPDTVWGPSWVTWRYASGYCGWAPLPPFSTYQAGIGFFYRGGGVSIGFNWGLGADCFTFVPTRYFCDPYPRRYCVAPAQATQIFGQTTVINNFNFRDQDHRFVNRGIDPERITDVTHTPLRPVAIGTANTWGVYGARGDQLSRDGGSLILSPPQPGSHPQPRPPQPNDNHPTPPVRTIHQPPIPVVTTRGPQDGNTVHGRPLHPNDNQPATPARPMQPSPAPVVPSQGQRPDGPIRVPAQPSWPAAGYNPAPAPNYDNRIYTPRQREQFSPNRPGHNATYNAGAQSVAPAAGPNQPGGGGAAYRSAPVTSPAPAQHSQPAAPNLSGQNQTPNNSGFGGVNGFGNGPALGPRR
ncbi:MAG TPA: DUF6600 domain-containing protein [Candidatus Acidoferrum sp.]|nr:DUF6600 domain-containing protein [Candidatus Acidoferrum sp.]